jgi:hypothetical protein
MGSGVATFRGTLTGSVSAAGKISLSFKGKSAASLSAGKYTVKVVDQSGKSGFVLAKAKRKMTITGAAFIGKHTATVNLTAGRWTLGGASIVVK